MLAPTRDFVQLLVSRVYDGRFTKSVQERFTPVVRQAFRAFINERINETLETAKTIQSAEADLGDSEAESGEETDTSDGIVTTAEEIQGYYIVKAILSGRIDLKRVAMRDVRSYCGVLLDDNSRKPICRLHFNNPRRKHLGLFDAEKKETRVPLEALDDIYKHAQEIRAVVEHYDASSK